MREPGQIKTLPEKWTIRELLQWTAAFFEEKGIASPRLNAEVLLAHVLEMDRLGLYLRYEHEVSGESRENFRRAIRRRLGREPLQYITGIQDFWSLPFTVTPHTLIPRPESEHLVELVLKCCGAIPLKENERLRILDIGTGCGNLAVALAREIPSALIVATDYSADALMVARTNAHHLLATSTISFICGDLLEFLQRGKAVFHIILSNPPYIPKSALEDLEPEVRDHEPRMALDGGENGLQIHLKIVHNAHGYLYVGGYLLLEIGQGQAEPLLFEVARTGWYGTHKVYPDFAGRDRVLMAQKMS